MTINERDRETIKNIIATVAYYDALSYPLTSFEVWKYMICARYYDDNHVHKKASLGDVVRLLEHESVRALTEQQKGLYALKGHNDLIGGRMRRSKISAIKLNRLREVVSILRFVPFVRMVAVTGTLAMHNAEPKSDWDLLVVLKEGKIWTGRTLVTIFAHLIGKRRHSEKIKDRVCLNHFITDGTLEVITKDLFSAHEYSFILPLFDNGIYAKFELKNSWIRKMKPQYKMSSVVPVCMYKDSRLARLVRKIGETLFSFEFIEDILRSLEQDKIKRNPNTKKESGLIYAENDALVFLPEPKGPRVFEKFKETINRLYP